MGTVIVAVAALVLSTIFNVITLRRSAANLSLAQRAFERTEARYEQDRIEARNDKLRAAIVDLSRAINGPLVNACVEFGQALTRHGYGVNNGWEPNQQAETLKQLTESRTKVFNPAIGEVLAALKNVRFLTDGIHELHEPLTALGMTFTELMSTPQLDRENGDSFLRAANELVASRGRILGYDSELSFAAVQLFSTPVPPALPPAQ